MLSLLHPGTEPRRHGIAALVVLCLVTAGCATSSAFHRGDDAERRQDYDLAVVEYSKALREHPDDANT